MAISYQVTPLPASHSYQVKLSFRAIALKQIIKLPVWIPGSYMLREFSKNIISLVMNLPGQTLEQISKNSWLLSGVAIGDKVELSYLVYAYEVGIRTAWLDFSRGYFNPSSLCLQVCGGENSQHQLEFADLPPAWQVACGLDQANPGLFSAENYAELIDCPFELGAFKRLAFKLAGVEHYLVLSGTIPDFDEVRLISDISKICAYQIELFAGLAPYPNYTFILNLSGEMYTGLEHRNSTLLMAPFYALPNRSGGNNQDYHKLLGLISHEFFHTWNVKRIKPKIFTSYDLDQENYSKLLWWFEGVTSYYDDLVLYKTGIINQEKYLGLMVANLNNVYKFAGVHNQTLANSSLTSWVKYYRQDENSPNSLVSYYVKGALVALCLDLLIRQQTEFSLDDVMRYLYRQWQQNSVGIAEDEIPQLIQAATGVDLSAFIYQATETTDDLPFTELLAAFGLDLVSRPANSHQESGKFSLTAVDSELPARTLDLGAKLEKHQLGYQVKNVYLTSSAHAAGLAVNDVILALNQVKLIDVERQLAFFSPGQVVELAVFRQERLLLVKLTLAYSVASIVDLRLNDQLALAKWL